MPTGQRAMISEIKGTVLTGLAEISKANLRRKRAASACGWLAA
jgi:hypothetical protein